MIYGWGNDHKITWFDLMAIDYAYHHADNDYANGVSFIDRLVQKLGHNHPFWNIEMLKASVTDTYSYIQVISGMLKDQNDIDFYGV